MSSLMQAVNDQLQTTGEPCAKLLAGDNGNVVLTGGLKEICARSVPVGSAASAQGPNVGNTHDLGGGTQTLVGEADAVSTHFGRWSLFANLEQESLSHDVTPLAGAFDANSTRINAGINYLVRPDSQLGLAIVSKEYQGDLLQGGDFSSSSLGFRLIADMGFGQDSFLQLLAGQDSTSTTQHRQTSFIDAFNGAPVFTRLGTPNTKYTSSTNEAAAVVGTRWSAAGTTFSPILGINWQHLDLGTYSEAGNSGL